MSSIHSLPSKPSTANSANLSFMAAPQPQQQPLPPPSTDSFHHHQPPQRLSSHALLPPLDIHSTRFASSKFANAMNGGIGNAAATLNSPAFAALGFGNSVSMMDGVGLGLANDLDVPTTTTTTCLSDMFEARLSLAGGGGTDHVPQVANLKNMSDSGWICSSARCMAHNLPNNSHCYICRSPRPHDVVLLSTSNPSTPPRSASSSSSTFSFPPSPSSTTSIGSSSAAFMISRQQQPHAAATTTRGNGALSGGTSLGLIMGGKTVYSTPPPPALPLPQVQQLPNGNGIGGPHFGGGGPTTTTPQTPLLALPPHLLPARGGMTQPQGFLPPTTPATPLAFPTTTATPNPLLHLASLTNILAPSGLRLSQGGRVRNVCPDGSNPILMFWPDNEPLPVMGQCRPPLPPDFAKNGGGAGASASAIARDGDVAKSNGLPPILNTGNVGPMEKQPLDWTCGVCKYINWRRRKVCQCCFPYAPGNEPPANHEDKLKIISALLTSSSAPTAPLPAPVFNNSNSAFNQTTPTPSPFTPPTANGPTPLSAAQHQLVQQIQRDQHQLLQMQLQLQIQKAQAQLNLFTQQQQQQQQQRQQQSLAGVGMGLQGVGGGNGIGGWNNSASSSTPSSEMGNSRAGSPFVLGSRGTPTNNFGMNPGLPIKQTPASMTVAPQSTPSPLSIFSSTSGAKRSIWAMDGETGNTTPTSTSSSSSSPASGSPPPTTHSSPTSFNEVDPEATVKLASANWFGSVVAQNGSGGAVGNNRFGEIGSGKVLPPLLGYGGVSRKPSLPVAQFGAAGAGVATPSSSSSSRIGSPAVFGHGSSLPSSSPSSRPSLAGVRTPSGGSMVFGNGSFGLGNVASNGGPTLF